MTPRNHKLFTTANPKTAKGAALGYQTIVLHLAPSSLSGTNVCPKASPGCIATCLNTAGRGVFPTVAAARLRRTLAYLDDSPGFARRLIEEIAWYERRAMESGFALAVRINGTSDLTGLARNIARRFPTLQFYDYTKMIGAFRIYRSSTPAGRARNRPQNLHLTFSRSETNSADVWKVLADGHNVATVFSTRKGDALPATWMGRPVIDGDAHDLRFLDPAGVVVGLRAKGKARQDASGFVVQV